MKKISAATLLCLAVLAINGQVASAHPNFKKELQAAYNLKRVSCYTCHMKKSEVAADQLDAFSENSKSFRNAFGKEFDKIMAKGNYSAKIKAAKDADDEAKEEALEAEALEAFKAALKKVGKVAAPSGKAYQEELTAGTLDGVTKE